MMVKSHCDDAADEVRPGEGATAPIGSGVSIDSGVYALFFGRDMFDLDTRMLQCPVEVRTGSRI